MSVVPSSRSKASAKGQGSEYENLDSDGEDKAADEKVKPEKPARVSKEENCGARAKARPSKIPRLVSGHQSSSGPSSPTKKLPLSPKAEVGKEGADTDEFEEEERKMLALETQVRTNAARAGAL